MTGIKLSEKLNYSLPLDVYEGRAANEEYTSKTIEELLQLLDEVYKPSPALDVNHDTWEEITVVLAERFRFARVQDVDEVVRIVVNEMIDKQNELIKAFIAHRHNKDENYSGKPIW